ncbi:MAG: Uncharacterised protein [Flavobacteriales bacterium]|nr:MAG: Uncharacterised protein [Flavobacteriales bacterium]
MEKLKNLLLDIYYDLMSNPLISIIIRIVFVCFILILIAYFLFYAILFGVILIPIYYIWKYFNSK